MRRFPAPWTVEQIPGGFKVTDANGQAVAYVYGHADVRDAGVANALTLDEARRIASNIAKLKAANHPPVSGANLAAQSPPVPYW